MGTTVSALDFVDDYAVIAHIGDSRIYLYRDDALTQITTDHTFVQRLVDSGRITPKRRATTRAAPCSCACSATWIPTPRSTRSSCRPSPATAGCSAPTASPASSTTPTREDPRSAPSSRAHGGSAAQAGARRRRPDNVTVVIVDVGGSHPMFSGTATIVGSASNPQGVEVPAARAGRTSWLHPPSGRQRADALRAAAEFLEELIEEDRRRRAAAASGGSSASSS
jgi:protein phosphatase